MEDFESDFCPNCGNVNVERHDRALSCLDCGYEKMEYFPAEQDDGEN